MNKFEKQAKEILAAAEKSGLKQNFFFASTLERYMVQLRIMRDLEKAIGEDGSMVTKEYVKGRANLYTNPAITEYNKTSTAANNTVAALLNILKQLSSETSAKADPLAELLKQVNE